MKAKTIQVVVLAALTYIRGIAAVATENMSDHTLTRMLVAQHPKNYYAELLSELHSDHIIYEPIEMPSFRGVKLYFCMLAKIGLNEHHFRFFVDESGKQATILTGSPEGLSKLLRTQRELNFGALDASKFVADLLILYRPNYVRVEPLFGNAAAKKDSVKGIDLLVGEESKPRISKDGRELSMTWVLREGRDIVVSDLKISASRSVEISELLRVKKAFVSTSPHD